MSLPEMSGRRCPPCSTKGKRVFLKKSLVARHPPYKRLVCYKCFTEAKVTATATKVAEEKRQRELNRR